MKMLKKKREEKQFLKLKFRWHMNLHVYTVVGITTQRRIILIDFKTQKFDRTSLVRTKPKDKNQNKTKHDDDLQPEK